MSRICLVHIVVAVFLTQAVAGREAETDWKRHVIPADERTFDFKIVAKGTFPEHRFVLKNPLLEPLHIGKITTSCACTALEYDEEKVVLKTYEEFVLTVRLRGDVFEGQRNATITIAIDKPNQTEIQLNVRGEIRTDLRISPMDFLDFGLVELGKEQSRSLTVTYTGSNTQWRIVDAQCENEFISTEISNEYFVGRKVFKVNVFLDKSAPNGKLNTLLFLLVNDAGARREIPIPLRAKIGTTVSVSPPHLSLGVLQPGEPSPQKEVVLRGTKAFRITKIECDNPAIEIPLEIIADSPAKILRVVPILYRNPVEGEGAPLEGVMRASVRVTTDIPGLELTFYVTASVRE